MDDQANGVGKNQDDTQCVGAKKVSLDKLGTQNHNAMRGGDNNWKIANCLQCGQEFKRNTTWQKYCCENCRQEAYIKRTGKELKFKKTATAG
jgi:hypothetical protein